MGHLNLPLSLHPPTDRQFCDKDGQVRASFSHGNISSYTLDTHLIYLHLYYRKRSIFLSLKLQVPRIISTYIIIIKIIKF